MKILAIMQCSNLGGMEKASLEWICILRNAGHDIQIYSLNPVGDLITLTDKKNINLQGSKKYRLGGLGNIREMLRVINQSQPDRLWLIGNNFGSLIAAKISGVPTSLSIHFHHCERSIWFWRIFYMMAKRVCFNIHFVTRYIFEEVSTLFSSNDKLVCFPNVFKEPEDKMSKKSAREILRISDDAFVVGNAGWLVPRKAFDVFLQTAALIKDKLPDAVFIIAGDGPERRHLEQITQELGLADCVMFLGWQQDLTPFYRALDVLLFNTNFDALGRTPVEALSYGVPVVASVINGGLNEFIRHGKDGYVIDQHDTEEMAKQVLELQRNSEYRSRITNTGKAHVLKLGSPARGLIQLNNFLKLQ